MVCKSPYSSILKNPVLVNEFTVIQNINACFVKQICNGIKKTISLNKRWIIGMFSFA